MKSYQDMLTRDGQNIKSLAGLNEQLNSETLELDNNSLLTFGIFNTEASKAILLGLAITVIVLAAALTSGVSLLPSAAFAVSSGSLVACAGFFAMKASSKTPEELTASAQQSHT